MGASTHNFEVQAGWPEKHGNILPVREAGQGKDSASQVPLLAFEGCLSGVFGVDTLVQVFQGR